MIFGYLILGMNVCKKTVRGTPVFLPVWGRFLANNSKLEIGTERGCHWRHEADRLFPGAQHNHPPEFGTDCAPTPRLHGAPGHFLIDNMQENGLKCKKTPVWVRFLANWKLGLREGVTGDTKPAVCSQAPRTIAHRNPGPIARHSCGFMALRGIF